MKTWSAAGRADVEGIRGRLGARDGGSGAGMVCGVSDYGS
jgi:hypothetical protein